jgi:hypothetical protein
MSVLSSNCCICVLLPALWKISVFNPLHDLWQPFWHDPAHVQDLAAVLGACFALLCVDLLLRLPHSLSVFAVKARLRKAFWAFLRAPASVRQDVMVRP